MSLLSLASSPATAFITGWVKVSAAALAVLAVLGCSSASAQTSPLVGVWSHSDYDKNGKPWLVTYLSFSAKGAVGLKAFYTGAPKPFIEVGQYKHGGSGALIEMVFRDFSPKQCFSIAGRGGCEPPPIALNQVVSRGIQFQGPNSLLFSDGAVYTRASAAP